MWIGGMDFKSAFVERASVVDLSKLPHSPIPRPRTCRALIAASTPPTRLTCTPFLMLSDILQLRDRVRTSLTSTKAPTGKVPQAMFGQGVYLP